MTKSRDGLTRGPILQVLLAFAMPMILGKCLQQVYNLVDTYIVGRFISNNALAAVGNNYLLITFINSLIIGLCTGSGAVLAHSIGSKNIKQFKKDMVLSFEFIFIVTLIIYLITIPNINRILNLLSVPSDIYIMSHDYTLIIFSGFIFTFIYNYFAFLLRALNNSFIPLLFLCISCVLNIFLDLYFVINLQMGVKGAAYATIISQAVSAIGILIYSLYYLKDYKLAKDDFKYDHLRMLYIIKTDFFAGLQISVMHFGALTIQRLINTFGTDIIVSFTAASKIDTFAFLPIGEFANAYSIFVSQNYGAKNYSRIKQAKKVGYLTMIIFGIILAICCNIFSSNLISIFVDTKYISIVNEGIKYIRIVSSFYSLIGILNLYYAHFRGLNKPFISFYLAIASLGTRNLIAYTLSPILGPTIIYVAVPIGWLIADSVGLLFDHSIMKKGIY